MSYVAQRMTQDSMIERLTRRLASTAELVPALLLAGVSLVLAARWWSVSQAASAPLSRGLLDLPVLDYLYQLPGVAVLGLLLIRSITSAGHQTVAADHLQTMATRWAWVWAGATLAWLVATATQLTGVSVVALASREDLFSVIGRSDQASAQVATLWVALVIALLGTRLCSRGETLALLVLGATALLPVLRTLPGQGAAHGGAAEHTVSQDLHWVAVLALAVQTIAVVAWVGGLVALVLHLRLFGFHLHRAIRRFAALASISVALIAISGLAQNALTLTSWADVTGTTNGQLLIAKAVAVALLVTVGLRHRQRTAGVVVSARLLRLVLGELVLMGAVVAVVLLLNPVR